MSDPAAVHAFAIRAGFDDLLTWHQGQGNLIATVEVYGLRGPLMDAIKVGTMAAADCLDVCLKQCEGHGLLWREDACLLYAARRLNTRPQPWAYSESDEINRLFDAIGAE